MRRTTPWNTTAARKLLSRSGKLVGGNLGSSAIGLVSFALTARALTPTQFGVLVLISTYAAVVERVVSFQSWQAYIKFGSEAVELGNDLRLRAVAAYCLALEAASLVTGALLGIAVAYMLSGMVDWLADYSGWVAAFCLTIVVRFTGITTGVLRLSNAFGLQAGLTILIAIVRLVCVLLASLFGKGLEAFLLAWLASELISGVVQATAAAIVFSRRSTSAREGAASSNFGKEDRKALLSYMWATNIEGTIRAFRGLDIPMLGSILSTEAAGIYAIARRVGGVLVMFVDTSFQAIYPELARLSSAKDKSQFRSVMNNASMIFGMVALVGCVAFTVIGDWLIHLVVGPSYLAATTPAAWCLLGGLVWAIFHPFWPALLAMGQTRPLAVGQFYTSLLHISLTLLFSAKWGVIGAAIAFLVSQTLWCIWIWRTYQRTTHAASLASLAPK